MIIIIKNITVNPIVLTDMSGYKIPASSEVTLSDDFTLYDIASSETLLVNIVSGDLVVNNGSLDLSFLDGIKYVSLHSVSLMEPHDASGKLRVQQTSRKIGLQTYFTGEGDDISDILKVGSGVQLALKHELADVLEKVIYLDFNIVENETWIHEGYITWDGAILDTVKFELVPTVPTTETGTNTNYNISNGIIIAAQGTGTVNITSDLTTPYGGLVYMPEDELGKTPLCFWNATWNSTTQCYENITFVADGSGCYNIFSQEITLNRFINKIPLLGSGFMLLQSSDSSQLGQGMRLKTTFNTIGTDHLWKVAAVITMHREKSC